MITVDQVSKSFGPKRAVDNLSFEVPTGSVCGFLGPNGAGKTTTIRMLAGAITPDSGSLRVGAADVRQDPLHARRSIGYLPESNALPPEARVEEYLRFRCGVWGVAPRERNAAVARVVERCQLESARRTLIGSLSRGFRQRVGLAAALVASPTVVILDEPATGLDPVTAQAFRGLVQSLRGEHTVLFSSHNLAEVEAVCDHLVLLEGGRLVAQGTAADLRRRGAVAARFDIECTGGDVGALRSVEGVIEVQSLSLADGWTRIVVAADQNYLEHAALCTQLAVVLQRAGASVRRFERVTPPLEDVFSKLVTRAAGSR
jgi:ABC-2 type transport system ATP-binding protein